MSDTENDKYTCSDRVESLWKGSEDMSNEDFLQMFEGDRHKNKPLKLNKNWTKNTHHKLYKLYIEIIRCLKYSDTREDAYYEIGDLNLEDPVSWAMWADEQFNNKTTDTYRNYEKTEDTDCDTCDHEHKYCGKCEY